VTSVRAVFVSDLHLGCRHSRADELVRFLNRLDAEYVYLVGDLIDGWCLKRRWLWSEDFSRVVSVLLQMARSGTTIRYTIGNHDDFLRAPASREMIAAIGLVEVAEEFIHDAENGDRWLILHGDRFDHFEQATPFVTHALSWLYNGLLCANRIWSRLAGGSEHGQYAFSNRVKQRVKSVVRHVSRFESQLADYARRRFCDGVICGHIHAPQMTQVDGIRYGNSGDWVENCSALIEHTDGTIELVWADEAAKTRHVSPASGRRPSSVHQSEVEACSSGCTVSR
jgi:UDP-2,3-diacylglucosamine pyrophosphatase LpxH